MSVQMIDCTTGNVAAVLARFGPQQPVAGYVTGQGVEWTESQFVAFARKIRIAQSADLWLDELAEARVLDVERFAATAADWPAWFQTRTSPQQATCYCSLNKVPLVIEACSVAGVPLPPRWWLAWYWQRPGFPTVSQTLAELSSLNGAELDPESVWAVQYASFAEWDVSRVFGTPDFSRR